jgi:3-oxoacyl-[acyl-carrier protein] reductase
MRPLEGRTALVTGGSRGIGRAIVERLVRDGASVVFSYHTNADAADIVAAKHGEAGGQVVAVRADQASMPDLGALFDVAEQRLGALDILVNNAAVGVPGRIGDVTEDDYDRLMAVNTKGPFFAMQHAGRTLRDNGRIINISTLNTVLPAPGIALYAASKAAVEQFTAVAAREFGPRGITVNTVSPGATETDLLYSANTPASLERAVTLTALGRLGRPADIANVVAFLAGPDSQWITGQNLRATGGLVL